MNEQPKMKDGGKNSVKRVFDNFKKPNNETKFGLDFADPKIAGRKLLCWVVLILIGLFSLCSIIYAVIVWRLPSGLMHVERNNNLVVEFDQRLLNASKSMGRATGSTPFRGVLKKNSSNEDVGFSTTIFSIERAASTLSSTVTSLHEDRTTFATIYESTIDSSQATMMESMSNNDKGIGTKVCSQIHIGSNRDMEERFQGLLGNYVAAGLYQNQIVYKNPNSGSLFYHDNGQLRINSSDYQTYWVIEHLDYVAFDIKCDYDIASTADCTPEWHICKYEEFRNSFGKLLFDNCSKHEGITYQCKNDDVKIKLEEDDTVCHVLELVSTDGIAKMLPETMGNYVLVDNLVSDLIVYVHKDMEFYLFYDSTLKVTTMLNQSFTGGWTIHSKTDLLLYNQFCSDANFPANGKCDFGWSYPFNEIRNEIDYSAKAICRNPSPVVTTVPADSVCKTFELTSNIALKFEMLVFLLGEYTIVEETYNEKAVYRKSYPFPSLFLHFVYDNDGGNSYVIRSEIGSGIQILYHTGLQSID